MRRITGRDTNEQGAIGVLVALLMVVLLGFVALAVDIGLMYSEKAQLQNGADAAALSIAQACSQDFEGDCDGTDSLAKSYADANALDELTNIQSVELDLLNRSVTVTTGALEDGGTVNSVSLLFANVFGIPTAEIGAKASAEWGSPIAGESPFPLAFSVCQVLDKDELQLLQSHGDGANDDCQYGPSGQVKNVPGGFGWIPEDGGLCEAFIDVAVEETAVSDPGNDGPSNCENTLNRWAAEINEGKTVVVYLPVFDEVISASPNRYNLIGFAAFDITGWKFSGNNTLPMAFHNVTPDVPSAQECKGDCRGVIGTFVNHVSLEDGYKLGEVNEDLGATVVRLKP